MKIKRIIAYIIDFLIISIVAGLIYSIPVFKDDYKNYQEEQERYFTSFKETIKEGKLDREKIIDSEYNLVKSTNTLNIIRIGVAFLYFAVLVYFLKGQTLGQKLLKLRIKMISGDSLNPGLIVLRGVLVSNILSNISRVILVNVSSGNTWYEYDTMIGGGLSLFFIILYLVAIVRIDDRGLHDLICQTKVINTKEEEN